MHSIMRKGEINFIKFLEFNISDVDRKNFIVQRASLIAEF